MRYYGLTKPFQQAGYFETEPQRHLIKTLKANMKEGKLVALVGTVGCGKTTLLRRFQQQLMREKEIIVVKSLASPAQTTAATLMKALFFDLSSEKGFTLPRHAEQREQQLQELLRQHKNPSYFLSMMPIIYQAQRSRLSNDGLPKCEATKPPYPW